jgi:RIO-like serine/threonine protein kinase
VTTKGLMLFTSHGEHQLIIVHGDGSINNVAVRNSFDVVCIDDNTAVVTSGNSQSARGINIVNGITYFPCKCHNVRI